MGVDFWKFTHFYGENEQIIDKKTADDRFRNNANDFAIDLIDINASRKHLQLVYAKAYAVESDQKANIQRLTRNNLNCHSNGG